MNEWTRDKNCVSMEDSIIIQRFKQRMAEKKREQEQKAQKEEEELHCEQIDFNKFLNQ